MNKKHCAIATGSAAAALAVACYLLYDPRPGHDAPIETVAAFVATDAFRKLPAADRDTYLQRLATLSPTERSAVLTAAGLSAAERETVLELIYSSQPANPVEQFATLRDPAERRKYLDRLIDAGGSADTSSSSWDSAARKRMLERTSPEERVRLGEFVGALNDRRRQRGLGPAIP